AICSGCNLYSGTLGTRRNACNVGSVANDNLELVKAGHAFRAAACAAAVPDVAGELVVVAAAAVEARARIEGGDVEAEDVAIEAVSGLRIAHLKMNVADPAIYREPGPLRAIRNRKQLLQIERVGRHSDFSIRTA